MEVKVEVKMEVKMEVKVEVKVDNTFVGISINPYLRCSSSRNFTKLMFKII